MSAPPAVRWTVEEMTTSHAQRWHDLETHYAANSYDGSGPEIRIIPGRRPGGLVISAPHATNHLRDGNLKYADRGTGGLAELLGAELGVTVVTAALGRRGDANHDATHPLKDALMALAPAAIVDLHGMKDRPEHPVQVDLGTGMGLTPVGLEDALAARLVASDGALFTGGRKPTTVTAWAQARGIPALQIEIAASFRAPVGSDENLGALVSGLLDALREAGLGL